MTEVKVVPIYESNYRDIPAMLDRLKNDCTKDNVIAVATVCFRDGKIDARSFGEWSMAEAAAAFQMAHDHLIGLLKDHMEQRSC